MAKPAYQRVLLKLSGEVLQGSNEYGIHPETLDGVAAQIDELCGLGVEVAVVIGGGNIFRGVAGATSGMDRTRADTMGMLATVFNCIALEDALLRTGRGARVFSAFAVGTATTIFAAREARATLEKGHVALLAGGTGSPYFTTDTAAALRALEVGADALLKATKVDGIYDKDPAKHPDATRFDSLTYDEVVGRQLRVMDLTAVTLCRDNGLPLLVFSMVQPGNIRRAVMGEPIATRVLPG